MLKKKFRANPRTRIKPTSSFSNRFVALRFSQNNSSYNRYAFVVSKRIDKKATARNRIKRLVRKCIEEKDKDLKKGYDMIFIIRKNITDLSSASINEQVKEILVKSSLIK